MYIELVLRGALGRCFSKGGEGGWGGYEGGSKVLIRKEMICIAMAMAMVGLVEIMGEIY